jgi:S1-C subfamily serine protease
MLLHALAEAKAGEKLAVEIQRGEETLELWVTLEERE